MTVAEPERHQIRRPAVSEAAVRTRRERHLRALVGSLPAMSRLETLPKIAGPATRALANAGITSLGQLDGYSRTNLAALHGMGPKALSILEASLAEVGLRLRD
jgi:hypothetical protein